MLKDDFCIVGIGQGGSKMAKEFYNNKYRGFFINTSYDDLSQLKVSDDFIYHVPAAKGCAKQREVAIEYGKNYYNQMTGKLLDTHPTVKVYIIHYTLGGGTGGGLSNFFMATLRNQLNSLKKTNAKIIAVAAKPREFESYQLQTNAKKSIDELDKLVGANVVDQYYIINNDSRDSLDEINQEHCILFDRWIEGEGSNNSSNVDESERMDLFNYQGQAMIFEFDGTDIESFNKNCKESYKESIYCHPIKKPKAVGLVLNQELKEKDAINTITDTVGYFPNTHMTPTKVSNMILVSGCDKNINIKNNIAKIANKQAELINSDIEGDAVEEIKVTSIDTSSSNSKSQTEEKGFASMDDIFKLFS